LPETAEPTVGAEQLRAASEQRIAAAAEQEMAAATSQVRHVLAWT